MNWNHFKLKVQVLCALKGITEKEIKSWKYKDVKDNLQRLNLI
jgi:hypothetical protein